MKLSKKQKTWTVAVIIIVLIISVFWYRENYTGERTGQVIDAVTGEPIEGAVVQYAWHTSGFMSNAMGRQGKYTIYETLTDKEGKYHIPNIQIKRESWLEFALCPEDVIIYKDGYAVYLADLASIEWPVRRPLGYPDVKQNYLKKNNIAKLYPWKEGESHYRHVDIIRGSFVSEKGKLLRNELCPEEKRAEQEMIEKWRQK